MDNDNQSVKSSKRNNLVRVLIRRHFKIMAVVLASVVLFTFLVFSYMYETIIFRPILKMTISEVELYLDQWRRTIEAFNLTYTPFTRDLLSAVHSELKDNPSISGVEISGIIKQRLRYYRPDFIKSIDWYIISPDGVVERTSYQPDLGLNLAKVIPTYWNRRVKSIKVGVPTVYPISFEVNTGKPRMFGYEKLYNGWILEIGVALDKAIISDLWKGLQNIRKSSKFVESVATYGITFVSFPPGGIRVTPRDKKYFKQIENNLPFTLPLGDGRYVVYENWIPEECLSNPEQKRVCMTFRTKVVLDLSNIEKFKKLFPLMFVFIVIIAVALEFFAEVRTYKQVSKALNRLVERIREFRENPLAGKRDPQQLSPLQISEILELGEAFEDMENEISEQMLSQQLKASILEKDVKALSERGEELEREAYTDSLTGLSNRRAFLSSLDDVIKKGFSENKTLVLCFMDLDGLKFVNDNYGHLVGDMVLKAFGTLIKENFRDEDIKARIGGDEFAVVIYDQELQSAEKAMVRLQDKLEELVLPGYPDLKLRFSYGLALWNPEDSTPIENLVESADLQMYGRKRAKKFHHNAGDL